MTLDGKKILVSKHVGDVQRQPGCPDDYAIASYLDGGLGEQEHRQLERHIAECDFCLALVGLLGRAVDNEPETAVSELLVARSARLVKSGQDPSRARTPKALTAYQRWAAAAVLVLACGLFIAFESNKRISPPSSSSIGFPEAVRQERNVGAISMTPILASPADGATVDPFSQAFTWSPVQDSLFYQVRIVNDEGDLLWQEQTKDVQWKLPTELPLENDKDYFVRVDAFVSPSKSLNSDYVAFRVLRPD